jgi:hypothetical protein
LTLKVQRNHYNVKFLKGYGHSISVKDSKIILKDNHDPFSQPTTEECFSNFLSIRKKRHTLNEYLRQIDGDENDNK